MVSFQCDGCQDVVKKPKLDQHRARGCGAGFTCIDCSTSFATPADWKVHTSCVSEAQKYQGSLYRGPKADGGGREHTGFSASKFQGGRGGSWAARPPTRYQATGANGTPLGTPSRMSPVTTPTPPEETVKSSAPAPVATAEPAKENGDKKSHKKRKLDGENGKAVETQGVTIAPDESKVAEKEEEKGKAEKEKEKKEKKDKKDKKEKKEKHKKADAAAESPVINGSSDSHEDAQPSSSAVIDSTIGDSGKKSKKSKKVKREKAAEAEQEVQEKSEQAVAVDSTVNGDDAKEKKKKKKKQKQKQKQKEEEDAAAADGDVSMADAQPEVKKKSKKRKRETEEQAETAKDATEGDAESGKKSKKKKKSSAA